MLTNTFLILTERIRFTDIAMSIRLLSSKYQHLTPKIRISTTYYFINRLDIIYL